MTEYIVIIEVAGNNYSAYAPDLPGCITTGPTVEETLANMREAIELHLGGHERRWRPNSRAYLDRGHCVTSSRPLAPPTARGHNC